MKFNLIFQKEGDTIGNNTGETFEGDNPFDALLYFYSKYPTAEFIAMYSWKASPFLVHQMDREEEKRDEPKIGLK